MPLFYFAMVLVVFVIILLLGLLHDLVLSIFRDRNRLVLLIWGLCSIAAYGSAVFLSVGSASRYLDDPRCKAECKPVGSFTCTTTACRDHLLLVLVPWIFFPFCPCIHHNATKTPSCRTNAYGLFEAKGVFFAQDNAVDTSSHV